MSHNTNNVWLTGRRAHWEPLRYSDSTDLTELQYEQLCSKVLDLNRGEGRATMYRLNVTESNTSVEDYRPFLLHSSDEIITQTLKSTTQLGSEYGRFPLRKHQKGRNELLSLRRINEGYSTDTWFATVTSFEGYNCSQIFRGNDSHHVSQYGMFSEGSGPDALKDFFRTEGVPLSIRRDNSKMQTSAA